MYKAWLIFEGTGRDRLGVHPDILEQIRNLGGFQEDTDRAGKRALAGEDPGRRNSSHISR